MEVEEAGVGDQGEDDQEAEAPAPVQLSPGLDVIMQSIGEVAIVCSHKRYYQHNLRHVFYIPPIDSVTLLAVSIVTRRKSSLFRLDSFQ